MTTTAAQKTSLGEQFGAAAAMLSGDRAGETADPRTQTFLQSLGFWPPADDATQRAHQIRMLDVAAGLDRFFRMDTPFAPGARFSGAMAGETDYRPAGSYAGRGLDLGHAFLTCIGEAAEHSAMYRRKDDARVSEDMVAGRSLVSGKAISIEAGAVLRTLASPEPQPSSTGYAAGPTFEAATESAFLECIERDAIARWSLGETRAAQIEPDAPLRAALDGIGRTTARPVTFADISSGDALAHSVAAVSADQVIGTAFGFGSAFSRHEACRKALLELCQGEIGLLMVMRKQREAGDGSLSAREKDTLSRASAYQPGAGLLDFRAGSDRATTMPDDFATAATFAGARGDDILICDITVRGEGIPVAKVLVTGLLDAAIAPGKPDLPPLL